MEKYCSKCHILKSDTEFGRNKANRSGLKSWCHACDAAAQRARIVDKEAKKLRDRRHYIKHKAEINKRNREYRARNRDACIERDRRYAAEHREEAKERVRRWKEKNGITESRRATVKKYDSKHKDEKRARKHKRRARIAEIGGAFTAKEFRDLCSKYGNRCLMCGFVADNLSADHVIPISSGGSNCIDNIQPLCMRCNSKKGTKTIDFRQEASSLTL